MKMLFRDALFVAVFAVVSAADEPYVAIAQLVSQNISGSVTFTESPNGLHATGVITGLPVGKYGFHVHELGDISTCDASGAHFNPDENNHGGRDHEVRHVGDLGNVEFVAGSNNAVVAVVNFTDNVISLRGRNSILGRTLVLHEAEDDLGKGNHSTSLTTGNAGARVACGVIGIKSPARPWTSAGPAITSSVILFILSVVFISLM